MRPDKIRLAMFGPIPLRGVDGVSPRLDGLVAGDRLSPPRTGGEGQRFLFGWKTLSHPTRPPKRARSAASSGGVISLSCKSR